MQLNAGTIRPLEQQANTILAQQVLQTVLLLQHHQTNPVTFSQGYAWQHPLSISPSALKRGYNHAAITVTMHLHLINTGDII